MPTLLIGKNADDAEQGLRLRLPDLKIVITGTQYGYRRQVGVVVVPIGALRD